MASTGVTQYFTKDAITATLRQVAMLAERMFLYFSRLLEEHPGTRIIPIALFSYDNKNRQEPTTYEMNFPSRQRI